MAKKFTDLAELTAPDSADQLAIVDISAGTSKKISLKSLAALLTPTGKVDYFAGSSAPTGYLLCDGSAVSRTTYADLYAVIGDTYGSGDGSTTFNLPDIRGRVIAGKDNMGGSSANRLTSDIDGDTLGNTGGRETTNHAFSLPGLNTSKMQDMGANYENSVLNDVESYVQANGGSAVSTSGPVRGVGGSVGTNGSANVEVRHARYNSSNVQPTLILNAIIKT